MEKPFFPGVECISLNLKKCLSLSLDNINYGDRFCSFFLSLRSGIQDLQIHAEGPVFRVVWPNRIAQKFMSYQTINRGRFHTLPYLYLEVHQYMVPISDWHRDEEN